MKTIKLIELEGRNYYSTSLTTEQYNTIKTAYNEKQIEPLSSIYRINLSNIVFIVCNNKSIYPNIKITGYLQTFSCNTGGEKQTHYRDYTVSLEKQKKMSWLVNVCSDYKASWQTVLLSLNRPPYCLIWSDLKDVQYDIREY